MATEDVLKNQLPKLKELQDSKELSVDNIDVFCEQGCFDVDQTRQILQAGKDMGLMINFHGEELHQLGSAEVWTIGLLYFVYGFFILWISHSNLLSH